MPALIPMHNTLGVLFVATVLSSMLVDTVNLVFCIYTTYRFGVTNFGDYRDIASDPWGQSATALSAIIIAVSVQHFYAYRIYRLSEGSPYLPAAIVRLRILFEVGTHSYEQSIVSLTEFGVGIVYSAKILQHLHEPDPGSFEGLFIAALACKVPCDVLITTGMVYYLLSNRSQVRRTNNVLNLLAIYSINCGALHLAFSIVCVTLFAKYPDTLIYTPSLFIMFRLSLCAFMAILNSRDHLRETLGGSGGVVATFSQLRVRMGTSVPYGAQETTEAGTNAAVPKSLPPTLVSSDTLPSGRFGGIDHNLCDSGELAYHHFTHFPTPLQLLVRQSSEWVNV
ncbi:hypothetical protein EDB87DRAFT_1824050 [Lactarius vividus]|nr:hypothetical protein EDB87DRAFT_1824050 [Lactarius vividus]